MFALRALVTQALVILAHLTLGQILLFLAVVALIALVAALAAGQLS